MALVLTLDLLRITFQTLDPSFSQEQHQAVMVQHAMAPLVHAVWPTVLQLLVAVAATDEELTAAVCQLLNEVQRNLRDHFSPWLADCLKALMAAMAQQPLPVLLNAAGTVVRLVPTVAASAEAAAQQQAAADFVATVSGLCFHIFAASMREVPDLVEAFANFIERSASKHAGLVAGAALSAPPGGLLQWLGQALLEMPESRVIRAASEAIRTLAKHADADAALQQALAAVVPAWVHGILLTVAGRGSSSMVGDWALTLQALVQHLSDVATAALHQLLAAADFPFAGCDAAIKQTLLQKLGQSRGRAKQFREALESFSQSCRVELQAGRWPGFHADHPIVVE